MRRSPAICENVMARNTRWHCKSSEILTALHRHLVPHTAPTTPPARWDPPVFICCTADCLVCRSICCIADCLVCRSICCIADCLVCRSICCIADCLLCRSICCIADCVVCRSICCIADCVVCRSICCIADCLVCRSICSCIPDSQLYKNSSNPSTPAVDSRKT
jgi:hypothetical protein